jgi:hypothetical protein
MEKAENPLKAFYLKTEIAHMVIEDKIIDTKLSMVSIGDIFAVYSGDLILWMGSY